MSKHIDADKLKKIVEQAKQRALKGAEVDEDYYCNGRADAFEEVLLEIDSLQQEQPDSEEKFRNLLDAMGDCGFSQENIILLKSIWEDAYSADKKGIPEQPVVKKSNALFDECVKNCDPAVTKEVSDNVDKMLERQPVEGLEEEIKKWIDGGDITDTRYDDYDDGDIERTARHFAEWGEKNAYKAIMKKADEVRDKRFDTDYEVKIEPAAGFDFGCVNVYHEGKLVGQYVEPKEEKKLPDDLEEAADEYASDSTGFIDMTAYNAFIAGAEYQRKQDQQLIELAEDHAMLAGMNKMKEEMMEKARTMYIDDWGYLCTDASLRDRGICLYREFQDEAGNPIHEVKVIVIPKED